MSAPTRKRITFLSIYPLISAVVYGYMNARKRGTRAHAKRTERGHTMDAETKARITDLEDRLHQLYEAQGMMEEVIEAVSRAIRGMDSEGWADAYVLAPLKILGRPDHGYLTRDSGIHSIVENLEKEIEEIREMEHEAEMA